MATRALFLGGIAAATATLRVASAALAAPLAAGDPSAAQRAVVAAIVPLDDPAFSARLTVDAVVDRVDALFAPLQDPAYRAAVLALGNDPRGPAAAYHAWFFGDDENRRRFAVAAKGMTMIAVYSDPAIWPAIGYGGPVLRR